jgi:protease-4
VLKFLIGVLTGVIFAVVIVVIAIFAIAYSFGKNRDKPATVASGSTLVLRLDGPIPERQPVSYDLPIFQNKTPFTVEDVWSTLRKAAADSRIKALVLEPAEPEIGWGKLQEIRADLENFKKSGKPVYAYLKAPGTRDYYLATAATRVYMSPEDVLNLKGMRFELTYFRRTLDKLGVQVDVEHAGKYKDFGDMFTRTGMTPETREVLTSVIDDMYGNLVQTLAAGRKKSADEMRAVIDQGPFTSTQALANGLVDEIRFEDEMYGELKTALKDDVRKVSGRDYVHVPLSVAGLQGKQRIAFITGDGDITRGDPESSSEDMGIESEHFNKILKRVEEDAGIKGVIVRIDSPGGESTASDDMWRAMNQLSRKKPMVISMSDAAASGGYYMAMTGDTIVAYPGTLTGSIGVVFGKPNLHGLYDKLGIDKEILSRGKFARIDSDYEPLNEEGRQKLREGIDEEYKSFVTKVAQARKRKFEEIEPLAQGRVWLGDQAKQNGLVDELGGIDRAIELVKQKAKIPAGENVSLVMYPPKRSIFEVLFPQQTPEAAIEAKIKMVPGLRDAHLKVWMRGGMLRMMPFTPSFR